MKFNEIKSFKIVKTEEIIVRDEIQDETCRLMDVVVEVNGENYKYECTTPEIRNKIDQIKKYFDTSKGKEIAEWCYNILLAQAYFLYKLN